jgi:hypothetical protein
MESDRPVIISALNRILEGLPLRVALNARIVRLNRIETGGIDDISAGWTGYMFASGTVAFFATYVPFRCGLVLDVVIDRMAAIT